MTISRDDVARKAAVGSGTVSRCFNKPHTVSPQTRERVLAAAAELGYVPNKSAARLRRKDNGSILVVEDLSTHQYRTWRNYSWMWASMERALTTWFDQSMLSMRRVSVKQPSDLSRLLKEEDWAGVLTLNMVNDRYRQMIRNSGIPAMTAASYGISTRQNAVSPDDAAGAALLAKHLKERGHERPIMVSYDLKAFPQRSQRYSGFHQCLPLKEVVLADDLYKNQEELGAKLLSSLRRQDADAVFVHSSTLAAKVLYLLMDAGLRPGKDISLVSYDNAHWLQHLPLGLTSVDNRIGEVIRQALTHLAEGIQHEQVLELPAMRIAPELVERESVCS